MRGQSRGAGRALSKGYGTSGQIPTRPRRRHELRGARACAQVQDDVVVLQRRRKEALDVQVAGGRAALDERQARARKRGDAASNDTTNLACPARPALVVLSDKRPCARVDVLVGRTALLKGCKGGGTLGPGEARAARSRRSVTGDSLQGNERRGDAEVPRGQEVQRTQESGSRGRRGGPRARLEVCLGDEQL